jgi:hypothetical protein
LTLDLMRKLQKYTEVQINESLLVSGFFFLLPRLFWGHSFIIKSWR